MTQTNLGKSTLFDPNARILTGTGSPEGVVEAPPSTIYRDLAITNGALIWVKQTGSGNTGWRVQLGDTGWRRVASWTAGVQDGANQLGIIDTASFTLNGTGKILLRRVNNQIIWSMPNSNANSLTPKVSTVINLFTANVIPFGLTASPSARSFMTSYASSGWAGRSLVVDSSATVLNLRITAEGGTSAILNTLVAATLTDDPWPTVLPGVAD